jgi:hypothetical protein
MNAQEACGQAQDSIAAEVACGSLRKHTIVVLPF